MKAMGLAWLLLGVISHAQPSSAAPAGKPAPPVYPERFHIGRAATAEEIARWAIAVPPDGRGLPPGRGTAAEGAAVYATKCAACHGLAGEGNKELRGPRLIPQPGDAYDFGVGRRNDDMRTIGTYWPYATTVFDYVRRAMPSAAPGSLTDGEVYAVTAFLLAKNGLIAEADVIDAQTLPKVKMPARSRYVPDDRLQTNAVR